MAIMNVKFGKLFYVILNNKVVRPFQEFLINIDEDERATILDKLEFDAVELSHGILKQDASVVSHIADNPNYLGHNGNWMCKFCQFYQPCLAIRKLANEEVVEVKVKSKSIENFIGKIRCRQQY